MMRGSQSLPWPREAQVIPGFAAQECQAAPCVCLGLRWVPVVSEEFGTDVGDSAGLISEGTRCWNWSPHFELQKLVRWCYRIKILNETNSKAGRSAEKFWGNECQGFKAGIVPDSQHQIWDKDVIHDWVTAAVDSEPAAFYRVLSSHEKLHKNLVQSHSGMGINQIKGWARGSFGLALCFSGLEPQFPSDIWVRLLLSQVHRCLSWQTLLKEWLSG